MSLERRAVTAARGLCRLWAACWLAAAITASALSLNKQPRRLPELLPELGPIEPSFWEQHGALLVAALVAAAAVLGVLVWKLRQPKPVTPPDPLDTARQMLRALVGRPEDSSLAAQTSQALRQFIRAALEMGEVERTAAEFEAILQRHPRLEPDLARALADFLRECEPRAFAPVPPSPSAGLVERALALADRLEAALRPPPASDRPAPPPAA